MKEAKQKKISIVLFHLLRVPEDQKLIYHERKAYKWMPAAEKGWEVVIIKRHEE